MLHSAFWQHGAGDIDLPGWWTSLLLVQQHYQREEEASRNEAAAHASAKQGFLLDFLYPAKTLAYIRKISAFSWETWETHKARQSVARGHRPYTSAAVEHQDAEADAPALVQDTSLEEQVIYGSGVAQHEALCSPYLTLSPAREADPESIEREHADHEALAKLKSLLVAPESPDSGRVWQLCMHFPGGLGRLQADVLCDLLKCFARSELVVDAKRYMSLFGLLRPEDLTPTTVEGAIVAQLRLDSLGRAARLYDLLLTLKNFENESITRLLMARCVHAEHWQLAIHVYESFTALQPQEAFLSSPFNNLSTTPNFLDKVLSLAAFAKENPLIGWGLDTVNGQFIALLAKSAMLLTPESAAAVLPLYSKVEALLGILKDLHILHRELFEDTLKHLYTLPAHRQYSKSPLPRLVWFWYRESPDYNPSAPLLDLVVNHVCSLEARALMEKVEEDCIKFYKTPWTNFTMTLMAAYARLGNASKVYDLFERLRKQVKQINKVAPLRSLVYVHARRAELEQAYEQFKRIRTEFGLEPDIQCWSILVHAHARIDDLDGTLQCLDNMIKAGLQPNEYTLGPVLKLCAARGDIDTVEALLDSAERTGIKISGPLIASQVQAYINNDDIEQAEAVVDAIHAKQSVQEQTIIWTQLLNGYALRKDMPSLWRIYKRMQDANVPLDSLSYAALMHGLAVVHQTDAAYKVLAVIMPRKQIRTLAFHYAIVISGFVDQGDYKKALKAHSKMIKKKIRPTLSTHIAHLKARALAEWDEMTRSQTMYPGARLFVAEDLLDEILQEGDAIDLAARQPPKGVGLTPLDQAYPSSYFELLIFIYGKRRSFEAVQELYEKYLEKAESLSPDRPVLPPIQLLSALMVSHLNAREHADMAKCWTLAKQQADALVQLWKGPAGLSPHESGVRSLPRVRRLILSRPLLLHMKSLSRQDKLSELQSTVASVLASGYGLDNLAWNVYVQSLAFSPRAADVKLAFAACEARLMPGWTGWAVKRYGSDAKGGRKIGLAHIRVKGLKYDQLLPTYKTMVLLASRLAEVRARGLVSAGVGAVGEGKGLREEDVRRVAPRTVEAVVRMPRVEDRLQNKYLRRWRAM